MEMKTVLQNALFIRNKLLLLGVAIIQLIFPLI